MSKVLVEFISTWPSCDEHGGLIKELGDKYSDKLEVKLYTAGKDFSYVKKYGLITKGTMIIGQKKKYDRLNRKSIEKAILEAIK